MVLISWARWIWKTAGLLKVVLLHTWCVVIGEKSSFYLSQNVASWVKRENHKNCSDILKWMDHRVYLGGHIISLSLSLSLSSIVPQMLFRGFSKFSK